MLENGTLVDGKYRILHEVGHGGMSVVYLALNERANKTWAIKEVRKNGSTSFEVVRQGLIAETNILKRLNHPHLPSIVDVIDNEDSFLVVMDYIEGVSLAKLLKEEGPQRWRRVVEWGKQLCDVLAYLHSRVPPIIYRDMKPDNVQLKPDGNIMLLDFGTAREYKYRGSEGSDTSCLGTRGYAAPEQYGGMGETDARTDIYCLGATLYHLLTGHNPSLPPYEMKPIRQINPKLPRGLERIILKCTQQDPSLRYQNCADLMYDLENIEKVNEEYWVSQRRKMGLFIASCALTLAFGVASIGLKVAANKQEHANYERAMESARGQAATVEQQGDKYYKDSEAYYKEAIDYRPHDREPYMGLANLYVDEHCSENAITDDEISSMSVLLKDKGIQDSRYADQYASLAFNWGSYIYFYYRTDTSEGTGKGSPSLAQPFLETAANADPADLDPESADRGQATKELASVMYNIAKGNKLLNEKSNSIIDSGGESYDYMNYWDDLNKLLDVDLQTRLLGANNSTLYMLSLYRSVMNAVNESMSHFKQGHTVEEIGTMIDNAEAAATSLYEAKQSDIEGTASMKEDYEYIMERITAARSKLEAMQ